MSQLRNVTYNRREFHSRNLNGDPHPFICGRGPSQRLDSEHIGFALSRRHALAQRRPHPVAPGFIEPCLPTLSARAPVGPGWIYEIKHDGYRLMVRKTGARVRVYTRRGADWTSRFPRIVQAARKPQASSLLLDGEGAICNEIGLAIFDRLHSKANDDQVFLYAFDVLEHEGQDCRRLPLLARKARLATLLRRAFEGIQVNEHLEGDGRAVFEHACQFGCEGIVAKRSDSPYRSGRSKSWIKVKNPESPAAAMRIEEGTC